MDKKMCPVICFPGSVFSNKIKSSELDWNLSEDLDR